MIKEVNDANFNDLVLKSDKTVVVDFWASWCGPCKMLAPIMEEVEGELKDNINFFKLNVDENPVSAQMYRVASIPTLIIFKNGKAVNSLIGFRPKESIVSILKKY